MGGRGCLMSPPCLESQGCHLIPLYNLFSCSSAGSCYPFCLIFFFSACWPIPLTFFPPKIVQYFLFRDRLFCRAPGQQLAEVSWSVVCAACCHMTLEFVAKDMCHIFEFVYQFLVVVSFLLYKAFFFNLVSTYQTKVHDTSMSQPYVLFQQG